MNWILLGAFILLSYTIEAITGFGSIVIALSLGALLMPINELLPILVPLNIFMSGFLVIKHRNHIQWRLLLLIIGPLMITGTLMGNWLRPTLGNQQLAALFAVVIIAFGARELYKSLRQVIERRHPRWLNQALIAGAGLTHGLFASGGPLLVFSLVGSTLNKSQMRATLLAVWFTLNTLLTLTFLWQGTLTQTLPTIAMYLPLLAVGIWMGEKLHHTVSELVFKRIIYGLLIATGSLLLIRALL